MKYCPTFDKCCPYFINNKEGACALENPGLECDDYFAYYGEEDEDEDW